MHSIQQELIYSLLIYGAIAATSLGATVAKINTTLSAQGSRQNLYGSSSYPKQ